MNLSTLFSGRKEIIRKPLLPLIILYGIVAVAGIVAIGLYTALFLFPPPAGQEVALKSAPSSPVSRGAGVAPAPFPPVNQNQPTNVVAPPEPTAPPPPGSDESEEPELMPDQGPPPRPRPFSPGEGFRGFPGAGRGDKFRDARRAILRDGKPPDFNQFEGREKEMLENMWKRYQQGGNRGGMGPRGQPPPSQNR